MELAAAAAADLALCSAGELAEQMRELHELELAAVAQRLRRLEVFDRIDGCVDDGQLTAAAWSRVELGLSHSAAAGEVSVARVRRTCPELARIFEAGRTSFRHLQTAAVAMRRLGQPEIWELLDERITGWAQSTTVREFAEMLDALVEQLRPEPKPKDEQQHDARRLAVTAGFDGMVTITGRLTPEAGEKLSAALSAASRPDVSGETRTAGQRKADALESVVDNALDTARLPVDGGEKPHISLLLGLDSLDEPEPVEPLRIGGLWQETAGQRTQRAEAAAAAAEALDGRPRFSWTGPTSPATARRLACDSILLPIFTRDGKPVDVGRRTRTIDARMRAFIVTRDQHCRWPGCHLTARWCQVHHGWHWKDGGPTDRWNLILLCQEHHRAAHSGKLTVVFHAPGQISTRPRRTGDPYYQFDFQPPDPPPEQLPLEEMLTAESPHRQAQS